MNLKTFFAFDPNDTEEVRLEKFSIFLVAVSCCAAGLLWTAMYAAIFGIGIVAFLPFTFVVVVGLSLAVSHITRNHHIAVYTQIFCIIYITAFIQWSIGGVFDSGFVLAWAFCGPIIALMFFSLEQSLVWLILYLLNIVITVAFDEFFSTHGHVVPDEIKSVFVIMNLSVSSIVVFIFASYFVTNAVTEREKANNLLLNILPRRTAETLKSGKDMVAERFSDASILFADIVKFTDYSSGLSPDLLVQNLNTIFLQFDDLTEKYRLEKIKTIGDAYMVAGGVPEPDPNHVAAIARLALEMLSVVRATEREDGTPFCLRIGIHRGPVVAGVIGKRKFSYDLWGDTVNVASRMESSGLPDSIQITEDVRKALGDEFKLEERGVLDIRGKGPIRTYFLKEYTG